MLSSGVLAREKSKRIRVKRREGNSPNADVVRFDVAVRDAVLLQPVGHCQQFLAKALQQIEREPSFIADALRQGVGAGLDLDTGHGHEQRRVATDHRLLVQLDDIVVPKLVQGVAFLDQARIVVSAPRRL